MTPARALLLTLGSVAALVGAVGPVVVGHASSARSAAERLEEVVLPLQEAVQVERRVGEEALDVLEEVFDGQLDATTVGRFLTVEPNESASWDALEGALEAADLAGLDDELARMRAEMGDLVGVLSEAFATGAPVDPAAVEAERGRALVEELRDGVASLEQQVDELVRAQAEQVDHATDRTRWAALAGIGALAALLVVATAILLLADRRRRAETARRAAERARAERWAAFEARLMRGLEMAKTERAVLDLVEQAIVEGAPGVPTEMLVAESSGAPFHRAIATNGLDAGCDVASPLECPAAASGQTAMFDDDGAIDTCPHLRGRGCSATCVPVGIAGRRAGMLHLIGPVGSPPGGEVVQAVEMIARRASERIAMVRAFDQTSAQANTDALTGLPNRRSFEVRLSQIQRAGAPYAIAYCDLDCFKELNDTYGHEMGDRALRLFARVVREAVRPVDVPARYGGEEFVLLLPNCEADEAAEVLERVRAELANAVLASTMPRFTCSFGLATSRDAISPEAVVAAADQALLAAKAAGRDRVVRADELVEARAQLLDVGT